MMYYSEKYKSQWWLPPRTASRMVKKFLDRLDFESLGHHSLTIVDPSWDLNLLVRNPYSIAVSYWYNRNERRYNSEMFTSFYKSVQNREHYLGELYVNNPSKVLLSEKIECYNLIKYESLLEDLFKIPYFQENQKLLKEEFYFFDLGNAPWRKDRPKELIKPYYEFYTQELADIVYTQKQSEFDLGGYHRDSWKTLVK